MPRHLIFGVDPGLLTGLALVDISVRDSPVPVWSGEFDTRSFYLKAEETIETYKDSVVVVVESFIISQRTLKLKQAPWSLKGWGAVESMCYKHNVPLTVQSPADAKGFSTNEKLHAGGFWHVGGDGHANDAFRHIMKYHSDRCPRWTKKL